MCGICGFSWEDKELIRRMNDAISHRGPNSYGYFTEKGVSLGHRRLSILDLSDRGKQPMFSPDNTVCIIFNGEIYNFKDNRKELEQKGHRFSTGTDTEVILAAYKEYGQDCISHFNGMFAFAIWDMEKKELFLARDRIGIKPLYYFFDGERFLFASEIKALLQYEGIQRKLNENCLKQIIAYAYPVNGESLIQGIQELRPGHMMVLKGKELKIRRYWDFSIKETDKSLPEYAQQLRELLSASVKRRLISDVPLGITLSGGIDSAMITALATLHSDDPIKTFTIGFDIPDAEFDAAQVVADHCKTDHTAIRLDYQDFMEGMLKVLWHMEYPISRPAMVPVYYLYEKLAKQVTVSLTGDGSDEIFAGYDRYGAYSVLPKKESIAAEEYAELAQKTAMTYEEKLAYISSGVFNKDKEEFFTDTSLPPELQLSDLIDLPKEQEKQMNAVLAHEVRTGIPYFHCNKLDRNSMAHGHETRVPFLDYTLVEFAMTIPSRYKFSGEKKIVLQEAAKPLLPKEIVKRRKLPMVIPLQDFFSTEFIDISKSVLSESKLAKWPYYKTARVQKLISDVREGKKLESHGPTEDNAYRQLLFLTNLELWIKLFIEGDIRKPSFSISSYL